MQTYNELKQKFLNSESTHYWVKDLINTLDKKDPYDVLGNLQLLTRMYQYKLSESGSSIRIVCNNGLVK